MHKMNTGQGFYGLRIRLRGADRKAATNNIRVTVVTVHRYFPVSRTHAHIPPTVTSVTVWPMDIGAAGAVDVTDMPIHGDGRRSARPVSGPALLAER